MLVGHYDLLWKTAKYNGGNWSNFLTKTHHLTRGCWIFLAKKPTTDSFLRWISQTLVRIPSNLTILLG